MSDETKPTPDEIRRVMRAVGARGGMAGRGKPKPWAKNRPRCACGSFAAPGRPCPRCGR